MPTLTVEENIILPLTLDGEKVSVMKRQLAELSERLGINHLLKNELQKFLVDKHSVSPLRGNDSSSAIIIG